MEIDFVNEWLERGLKEEHDIFKFFCYYIAFNWIYKDQKYYNFSKHFKNGKSQRQPEYEYIMSCINDFKNFYPEYNPFDKLVTREFNQNVRNMENGANAEVKDYIATESDDIVKLFLNIYQVRCNLFHGSKSMSTPRNRKLVQDACKVLEDLLKTIIETNFLGGSDYA